MYFGYGVDDIDKKLKNRQCCEYCNSVNPKKRGWFWLRPKFHSGRLFCCAGCKFAWLREHPEYEKYLYE